jgi:hypothetical protein
VELRDKSNQRVAGAPGSQSAMLKAATLGLTGDIGSIETPEARAKLSEAMRDQLRHDLVAAMQQIGY